MSFLNYFNPAKKREGGKVIRIRITKSTQARHHQKEQASDVEKGEVIDVLESEAAMLIGAEAATRIGEVGRDGNLIPEKKAMPAKPAPVPEPAPSSYKDLPAPFTTAWDLLERRRILCAAIKDAIEVYLPGNDKADFMFRHRSGDTAERNIAAETQEIERCRQKLEDFDQKEGGRIADALVAAGCSVLNQMAQANEKTKELAELGFQLFNLRIAALELAPEKARSLFLGSALAMRYASIAPYGALQVTSLGQDRGDTLDLPLPALASHYQASAARLAEIEPLLAQASAAFAAAQGVTAKTKRAA